MTPAELYAKVGPSVANVVILRGSTRVSSGTGFLVNGKLVTCGHVLQVPVDCYVRVVFENAHGSQSKEWTYPVGQPRMAGFSDENSYDYAILPPPEGVALGPDLQFASKQPPPGSVVFTLGYPFEDPHLTIHQGLVSASFQSGVATMLKLDMSVNPSNSGGPLIDADTGEILGVVARKATGLTQAFANLMRSYDDNVRALQQVQGMMFLGTFDPIEAMIAGQHQMKTVSVELQRSSNVGIGYAVWCEPLRREAAIQ